MEKQGNISNDNFVVFADDVKIDIHNYQKIMNIFREQLSAIVSTDVEYYGKYPIVISNEQYYVSDEDRDPNKIYIVIKFLAATIEFGQFNVPVLINAVTEANSIDIAQRLLIEYTSAFNQKTLKFGNDLIYQNYEAPNITSNFEAIYDGYRSLMVMSGAFLLSSNINRCKVRYFDVYEDNCETVDTLPTEKKEKDTLIYNDNYYKWNDKLNGNDEEGYTGGYELYEGEYIDIINFTDSLDLTPDTQPFFHNNNFTTSINKYGTYTFNIVMYLTKDSLVNKYLKIKSRKISNNASFIFAIDYDDASLNMPRLPYKMISASSQQNKGEMPFLTLVFTN